MLYFNLNVLNRGIIIGFVCKSIWLTASSSWIEKNSVF